MEKVLKLASVIVDNRLNPREGALDQEAITEYAANIEALPVMHVFEIEDSYYLTRGFHRFAAHQLAGKDEATFAVHEGNFQEAQEDADLDNLRHGLRLTRAEKRGVIARYLKRHPARSDVWIARDCHTTDKTVRSVREALEEASEIPRLETLMGSDGVDRPRSVSREDKVKAVPGPSVELAGGSEPEWLEDDGFSNGAMEQGGRGAGEISPSPGPSPREGNKPEPPPPPPPKLPPPPPPIIRESTEVHVSVWVREDNSVVIMGTQGLKSLEARPVEIGEIGAEVQRLVDETLAVKA